MIPKPDKIFTKAWNNFIYIYNFPRLGENIIVKEKINPFGKKTSFSGERILKYFHHDILRFDKLFLVAEIKSGHLYHTGRVLRINQDRSAFYNFTSKEQITNVAEKPGVVHKIVYENIGKKTHPVMQYQTELIYTDNREIIQPSKTLNVEEARSIILGETQFGTFNSTIMALNEKNYFYKTGDGITITRVFDEPKTEVERIKSEAVGELKNITEDITEKKTELMKLYKDIDLKGVLIADALNQCEIGSSYIGSKYDLENDSVMHFYSKDDIDLKDQKIIEWSSEDFVDFFDKIK